MRLDDGYPKDLPTRLSDSLMVRVKALLRPGLGLKRWLVLLALGLSFFSIGVGFAMAIAISPRILLVLRTLALSGFSPMVRGGVFVLTGTVLGLVAAYQTYRWIALGISQRRGGADILTAMDLKYRREHGLSIVAIGGGTGVSTLLRGLK